MNILVAIVLCGIVYVLWQGIQSGAPRADRGPVTAVYGILLILVVWVGLAWAAWLYSGLLATAILLAPPVLLWIFSGRRSIPTSWGARGRAVVPTAPSERKLDVGRCFSSTYGLARGRFRKLAQRRKAEMFTLAIPEIGPEGEKLTTDIAWLGGQKPVNVLLHLSGMAGFDGFAGSAIQIQWLRASIPVPEGTAVVLVHAGDASGMASGHHSAEARVEERENALRLFMEQHFDWAQRIEVIDVRLAWDEAVTEEAVAASRWDFGLSDDTSVQGVVQMIPSTWLRDPARILARGQQEIASALRRLEQ